MIKKLLLFLLFSVQLLVFSQENLTETVEQVLSDEQEITYYKTTEPSTQREFKNDLKSEYSGKDFTYIDDIKKPKKKEIEKVDFDPDSLNFLKSVFSFFGTIFPYLLALIVILILVKSFLNTEGGIFKVGKVERKVADKLVYEEDENIENNDYVRLLKRAIENNDYRLATRYYYLSVLKKLSQKNLIDYHKDKTNSEYLFELKNEEKRKQFSYLSYIYDYVWYGEFPVDKVKFDVIETNYKSFIKTL